jgi:hypothetical protein
MPNQGALADLDVDAALEEISSGVIAQQIAARYGVTADGVRRKLARAKPEEYKDAVARQVEHWVFDSAAEMNELPADAVCIARARARADFRLKLASKLNPAYADKVDAMGVQIVVNIAPTERVVGATMGATAQIADDKLVSDQ